jgi:hypothetical protein
MPIRQKTFELFLNDSRETIFRAFELEDIKARMLNVGYTDEKLLEGQTQYQNAYDAMEALKTGYAEQMGATDEFVRAEKEAYDFYSDIVKMARYAVREDKEIREMLELDVKLVRSFGRWTAHAMRLYTKAKESEPALLLLSVNNINQEKLDMGLQLISAAREKKDVRDDKKGIAQDLTTKKNEVFRSLRQWLAAFKNACRIEFKDDPQNLERLGILVYSDGYVSAKTRQKNEEKAGSDAEEKTEPESEITEAVMVENDICGREGAQSTME